MQQSPLPFALALLTLAACALLSPSAASAHARYESSSPAKGEILAIGPDVVEITFSQEIQRIAGKYDIQVNKDRGPSVTSGPAVVNDEDRTQMSVPLQSDLADGRYVVHWNNVSDEDGDPAEGAFSFYINYEPNTVDLENDRQLELIGAEETPTEDDTPSVETPFGETPSTSESPATTPAASPTAGGNSGGDDDGGSSANVFLIVVGSVALAAVLVGGGYFFLRGRGA